MNDNEKIKYKHLEEAVRHLYTHPIGKGEVNAFCKKHNINHNVLSKIACKLQVRQPKKNNYGWNEGEIKILTKYKGKSYSYIRRNLKAAGFCRSDSSIANKCKRMGFSLEMDPASMALELDCYSRPYLASLMGVSETTVKRWIDRGLLKFNKSQESDKGYLYYKITSKHIKDFITNHVSILEIAKIDKFWLVDMLTKTHKGT